MVQLRLMSSSGVDVREAWKLKSMVGWVGSTSWAVNLLVCGHPIFNLESLYLHHLLARWYNGYVKTLYNSWPYHEDQWEFRSLDEKEESLIKRRRKLELCLERDDASIWKSEGYDFLAGCRNLFNAKVHIFLRIFQVKTPNANGATATNSTLGWHEPWNPDEFSFRDP